MQKVSTQDLSSKLSSLVEKSGSIKLNEQKSPKKKEQGAWFHGTYRNSQSRSSGYRRSNSDPNKSSLKVSSLWNLLSPMDEDVRRKLNSIGLDRHVRQIAELGIESMSDLRNPYMVTDRQLRKIGMTPSSIERYRTLCVIPRLDSLNEKDSFNESSTCGGGEPPPPQQPLEVVKAASSLSFKPLLVELGIEEDMDTLKKACGDDDSTRTLLLKVSEEDMKGLGIPLVKARKLLDMIRSIEADALTNWNGEVKEPAHAHLRPGRRQSGCTVDPILIELDIAHLRNAILTTAGSLDVFDILRVTELELVERCRVPRMQARKLRRRALQAAKVKNDDTDNSSSPNNKTPTKLVVDDMVEEKGEDDSDDEVAPFDRRLKSGLSFGGTPRSSNLNRDQFSWFRRAQSNQN